MSNSILSVAPLTISPQQLSQALKESNNDNVKLLDVSWFMSKDSDRNGRTEFLTRRIPGAQYLDLDEVATAHELGLRHMMPSSQVFADACGHFGITSSTWVVLYDTHGVFSSPRALFMFRSFGHVNSSILDGGLPLWEDLGLPIATHSDSVRPERVNYPPPDLNTAAIRDYEQMVANSVLDSGAEIVLDSRSRGRFLGTDAETRPGIPSGHIPNSYSLPYAEFLTRETTSSGVSFTTVRPVAEIRQVLIGAVGEAKFQAIMKGEASVVTTCGSGMSAGILWLGLKLLGADNVALFDESWRGYASRPSSVIAK